MGYMVARKTVRAEDGLEYSHESQEYKNERDAVEDFRGYTARETFAEEWRDARERSALKETCFVVELWEGEELLNSDECDYETYREWEAAGFPNEE